MNNKLGKAICNFRENPCDHTAKEMTDFLWNEIIDAVKGQKVSRCGVARLSFNLSYPEDCKDISNSIADEIELYGIKKGFNDALAELFKTILSKIETNNDNTVKAMSGSETDRKRWIRNTLGYVLANKIFRKDIENWRKGISNTDVPLEKIIDGEESQYEKNILDSRAVRLFWKKYYEGLKDENNGLDVIKWQREAFFWRPGKKFHGIKLTGDKSDRAIYVAFFYSWLRRCSRATFAEIALESEVTTPTVSRNWKPHPELGKPFPDPHDDKEGRGRLYEIFYPVYFHKDARFSIGMYDPQIRCFKGTYDENGNKYPPILRRKKILWDIYNLLRDSKKIRYLKINYDSIDSVSEDFSLEIISNEKIGISSKKGTPFSFVHIKTIEVGNAQNTN